MSEKAHTHATEKADLPGSGMVSEEEWGVRYGASERVSSQGTGYWGMRHAQQEVERVRHNATLPFVGQPATAEVVSRTVTRYYDATPWAAPSENPSPPGQGAGA